MIKKKLLSDSNLSASVLKGLVDKNILEKIVNITEIQDKNIIENTIKKEELEFLDSENKN